MGEKLKQSIVYKVADRHDVDEMRQIHELNYETFVEEIPQHAVNESRQLIDKFHDMNTYIIAKLDHEVIGMISINDQRPFSLDVKLGNVETYFEDAAFACEVRLLAVKEAYRGGVVFFRMCERLVGYSLEKGYSMALISGTVRQLKLYKHLGFKPFAHLVGTEDALYQPMYLTVENFRKTSRAFLRILSKAEQKQELNHSFVPGPVSIPKEVQEAWAKRPISHRSVEFKEAMSYIQKRLCNRMNAKYVEILSGTGTLANEVVAAQILQLKGKGLVIANGEFGERLICHARRWGLQFETIQKEWGSRITIEEISERLAAESFTWLWTVHCETSTGFMHSLDRLKEVCGNYDTKLCIDACSTIGTVPVDLDRVYLASGVSGKGLGSYPGLGLVFHNQEIQPDKRIPAYLDLGVYQNSASSPYTHCSNSLFALQTAVDKERHADPQLAIYIKDKLRAADIPILDGTDFSPGIITIAPGTRIYTKEIGDQLKALGVHTSYESSYLLERNWLQLALMGDQQRETVLRALDLVIQQFRKVKERV